MPIVFANIPELEIVPVYWPECVVYYGHTPTYATWVAYRDVETWTSFNIEDVEDYPSASARFF